MKTRWSGDPRSLAICVLLLHMGLPSAAAELNLQISDETAPAGGWAQIKIFAAAPIGRGRIVMNLDPAVFGPIARVAVFSPQGDAEGVATVNDRSLDANFESLSAGIGQLRSLPVLTVTVPVLSTTATGTTSPITLDTSQSNWIDTSRNSNAFSVTPGSVTVGGSLSIQNVSPGGGLLAADSLVRINGTGFVPATSVSIAGVSISGTQFIGPNEIDLTLGGPADLTGKKVTLTNPDGSHVQLFSAMSSAPDQNPPGFSNIQPILSTQMWTGASTVLIDRGVGIALQNPHPAAVEVILQSIGIVGGIQNQETVSVPPSALYVYRNGQEFPGSGFNAFSTLPLRMLGIVTNFAPVGPQPTALPSAILQATPPLQKVVANPPSVSFIWETNTAAPAPVNVNLGDSAARGPSAFRFTVTSTGSPFSVTSIPGSLPGSIVVAVNPTGLRPGVYAGAITITPEGPNAVETTIPLTLTVSQGPLLTVDRAGLTFFGPSDDQTSLTIASTGAAVSFSARAATGTGPTWLSVSPQAGTAPGRLTVHANSTALPPAQYQAQIIIDGPNNSVIVPVQLTVGNVSDFIFSPPAVTFVVKPGSSAPATQTVLVDGPSTGAAFSASTSSGVNWLTVSKTSSGQLGAVVTANPAGLATGTYRGSVTLTSPGVSTPASFPVILLVSDNPPKLIVNPASITISTPILPFGTLAPSTQVLSIDSTGVPLNFTSTVGGISVTPASIPIAAQPGRNLGSYQYNVSITSGSQTVVVPVTTVVTTGPSVPPFLGSIVNAASQLPGSVSPGEILTIYGFGAGPSNTAGFTLDGSGNVATALNGAEILFDGKPAPMIYGSAYQANVIVPYEVDGHATTTISLRFGGVTSEQWTVPVTAAAPGIFTVSGTGTGQAAVLNGDNSVNSASIPAIRGTTIQIYATGEGQTSPPGVTGSITGTNLKKPLQDVKVTIGDQDAAVEYAGSAGDSIAGLLQLNVVVPRSVSPGSAVPVVVSVGGVPSQPGVTVAVQ